MVSAQSYRVRVLAPPLAAFWMQSKPSNPFYLPDDEPISQRQWSTSVPYSPHPHHADALDVHYNNERGSASDQHADSRYSEHRPVTWIHK